MEDQPIEKTDWRQIGLIANPFDVPDDESTRDSRATRLAVKSAAMRLLGAFETAAADPESRPIIVEKTEAVPAGYHVAALAQAFGLLTEGEPVAGVLSLFVPLDALRSGRVRAVLSVLAERASALKPDVSIGDWAQRSLTEFDQTLPEWQELVDAGVDIEGLKSELAADAAGVARRVFGEPVDMRSESDDLELLVQIGASRQERLETDVEGAVDESSDEATDDELSDAFTLPLGEGEADVLPDPETASHDGLFGDYVIAYVSAHLSPVVARGIRAYHAQGISAMTQELKVTKAPLKTLAALTRFVERAYPGVVVVYDRFEMWSTIPDDLRARIVRTFTEMRWALKGHASLCFLIPPGAAPEVEETFAAARRVSWDFSELFSTQAPDSPFDVEVARTWIASVAPNGIPAEWVEDLLGAVPDSVSHEQACAALAAALDEAVATGGIPVAGAAFEAVLHEAGA